MSVQVSFEELEALRTAPASPINRNSIPRWGRPRAPKSFRKEQNDFVDADTSQSAIGEERWREYCEYEPGSHIKLSRRVKRIWKKLTEDSMSMKEFCELAGKGVMQMGFVWGGGLFVMRHPVSSGKRSGLW